MNFDVRPGEEERGAEMQVLMPNFDLGKALDSEDGFVDEYVSACDLLGLVSNVPAAVNLYRNWRPVRCAT